MRADSCGLPWPRINDYVVSLGSASTKQELLQLSLDGIGDLVPYDTSASIFDMGRKIIYSVGLSERIDRDYNEYYRYIELPFCLYDGPNDLAPGLSFLEKKFFDFRSYADSEYYSDFAGPNGLEYAIGAPTPFGRIILIAIRSRRVSPFSEREARIIEIANTHLNNLYRIFDKASTANAEPPTEEAIRDRFSALSRREAEIGRLFCLGLTAPEIASKLYISERTVESHVAHIYEKLDVRRKREAIALLTDSAMKQPRKALK